MFSYIIHKVQVFSCNIISKRFFFFVPVITSPLHGGQTWEKLSFILRIGPGNLLMDILRDSQLVIFYSSTIFITFFYKSLAGFLFKLIRSLRRRKPEVSSDSCVLPLSEPPPSFAFNDKLFPVLNQ